jgi:DNA-binding transcriptional regulator YiaG
MSTLTKIKRRGRPRPVSVTRPDFPHTFTLPDGRSVYVEVPGHMTALKDGETVFLPAAMEFLDKVQALAMKIVSAPRPAHVTALRGALGMTQTEFGAAVGVDQLTVSRWERGELKPGASAIKRLMKIQADAVRRGVVIS